MLDFVISFQQSKNFDHFSTASQVYCCDRCKHGANSGEKLYCRYKQCRKILFLVHTVEKTSIKLYTLEKNFVPGSHSGYTQWTGLSSLYFSHVSNSRLENLHLLLGGENTSCQPTGWSDMVVTIVCLHLNISRTQFTLNSKVTK